MSSASDITGTEPLFVDVANGNYTLQNNSTAIDAGTPVGRAFLGAAPDLGAFEYRPGGDHVPPAVPRICRCCPDRAPKRISFRLVVLLILACCLSHAWAYTPLPQSPWPEDSIRACISLPIPFRPSALPLPPIMQTDFRGMSIGWSKKGTRTETINSTRSVMRTTI